MPRFALVHEYPEAQTIGRMTIAGEGPLTLRSRHPVD